MASSDGHSIFYKAIEAVFTGWTALQLAVVHGFGGSQSRQKAEWFMGAVEQWFLENKDIDPYELEEFLEEIMSREFNTVVDDNSPQEVSVRICKYYSMLSSGKITEVESLIASSRKSADVSSSQPQPGISDDEDGDEDNAMDVGEQNMLNHINALELDNSQSGTDNSENNASSGSKGGAMVDEDGWTVVSSKGKGRKNR